MSSFTSNYRENHRRAIYVCGEINEDLLHKLTPQINALRCESRDPITVYIDSVGGSVPVAERLRGLLVAPTPEGEACSLVTVVTGLAASAAADLLALGGIRDCSADRRHPLSRLAAADAFPDYLRIGNLPGNPNQRDERMVRVEVSARGFLSNGVSSFAI